MREGRRVLLVRPAPPGERFGLGPFFRVEPLGLEYVAAALLADGHDVRIADLRWRPSLASLLDRFAPDVVGVSAIHSLDTGAALAVARETKRRRPGTFTVVGGHAAALYPRGFMDPAVDAIAVGDGETTLPALARARATGRPLDEAPGFHLRDATGAFVPTAVPLVAAPHAHAPARRLVEPYRRRYRCVHRAPLWAVETARGCPYRCSFCSVWRRHERGFHVRDDDATALDLAGVGDDVFLVDDLFFHPRRRSLELARLLGRRGVRKRWLLAQARLDVAARRPEVLEAWRPLARDFDLFFGFEAPSDAGLAALDKDLTVDAADEGVRVARRLGFGVTGNFVVDPDWGEAEFEAMWAHVDRLGLDRVGYTVLTPLPGTPLWERMQARIVDRDPAKLDMAHVLWEPRLGRRRFFELLVASWRRNVLSARHAGRWLSWLRHASPRELATLVTLLVRTQRLVDVDAYLAECFVAPSLPAGVAVPERGARSL